MAEPDEEGATPPRPSSEPPVGTPADLPFQVPADARALQRDVRALTRERRARQRSARRRQWLSRLLAGRRSAAGVPALALVTVLLVAGVPVALAVLLGTGGSPPPSLPRGPGTVGGPLPPVVLLAPEPVPARQLARPAALVLVPARCGCDDQLRDVLGQVRALSPTTHVVVQGSAQEAQRLRTDLVAGPLPTSVDPAGALAATYGGGLTVLAVAADGRVLTVLPGLAAGERLAGRFPVLRSG